MTNKYSRLIVGKGGDSAIIDVYRVLEAYSVKNPQLQHLIKKALACGLRGHKDTREDLVDIVNSANSALQMHDDIEHLGKKNEVLEPK